MHQTILAMMYNQLIHVQTSLLAMRNKRANTLKSLKVLKKQPIPKVSGRTSKSKRASVTHEEFKSSGGEKSFVIQNTNLTRMRTRKPKGSQPDFDPRTGNRSELASSIEFGAHNTAKVGIQGAPVQTGRYYSMDVDAANHETHNRHCICDEDVSCSLCTVNGQCSAHDGLFCSACDL